MSENNPPLPSLQAAWGMDLAAVSCKHCHSSYLIPCVPAPAGLCPNCSQDALEVIPGGLTEMAHPYPPELILPASLPPSKIDDAIRAFAAGIPFAPPELTPNVLRSRLTTMYLPMWLVDGAVSAYWQAEAGFDYQVLSHQELYEQGKGGWKTREVKDPRIRWENRVGRLDRAYQNVAAPALDDAPRLEKQIGSFHMEGALSYTSQHIQPGGARPSFIRLPDHPPEAAWCEASTAFQKTAADECRRACEAGHLRQFRWKAQFARLNWTLMLLPVYSTCYADDHGKQHTVLIHGQTGAFSGERRASVRRAGQFSLSILIVGILLFLAGLLLDSTSVPGLSLFAVSPYIIVLGLAGILASGIPFIIVWDFNRKQALGERANRL